MDKETLDKLSIYFFIKLFELGNGVRGWTGEGPYVPYVPLDQRLPNISINQLAQNDSFLGI